MDAYGMLSIKSLFSEVLAEKSGSYIVEEIFARFPSIVELMNVTEHELTGIRGIGQARARQIIATLQLAKKLSSPVRKAPYVINSPKDAADLLLPEMQYLQQEYFIALFLNTKNHIIGKPETISIGSLSAAIVHPREVFKAAIKRSAASVLVSHNHPSGDCTPSQEDIQLTKRLVEAGNITGIEVLDHIITGFDTWLSMKESNLMN